MQKTPETHVRSLGWEDRLEQGMATHSSILAWTIPRTEDPGGLQSTGPQRVGHDWTRTDTHRWSRTFLPVECVKVENQKHLKKSHKEYNTTERLSNNRKSSVNHEWFPRLYVHTMDTGRQWQFNEINQCDITTSKRRKGQVTEQYIQ